MTMREVVADEREKAERDVRVLAQLVSSRLDDVVREHAGVLSVVARTVRPNVGTRDTRDSLLAEISRHLPAYITNLSIYDARGENIGHTYPFGAQSRPNVSDRRYFIEALHTKRLAIGEPNVSRLSGRRIIGIVLPVLRADSTVEAVVGATVELDYLLDRIALPNLPAQSVINVIDTSGMVVARTIDAQTWIMRNVRRHPAIQPIFLSPSGAEIMSGLDGIPRYIAYLRTGIAPWIITIGVPPEYVEGPASQRTWQGVALGLLSLLCGLVVAALFARRIGVPVRQLSEYAQAYGAGDATRRVDVDTAGPLESLAIAFNHMADELDVRARESTAQREALSVSEAQLRQAQKMDAVGQLAGGIAHDFNNLLTVVLGHVSFARSELATMSNGRELSESLAEIHSASTRAAELTRQLLTFARRQRISRHAVNLNETARGIDRLLRRVLGEHIELATILAEDLWVSEADASQVEQVLVNLAVNARDAMPDGGLLTIESHNVSLGEEYARANTEVTPGEYVMLSVTDTGTGIAPEHLPHLFEPFFTTKAPGAGTGLGLAVCYGIAKRHGGHISVYSELGHGTTVRFYLPRSINAADAPINSATPAARRGHETILVVEDTDAVRAIAQRALTVQGYTVLTAVDGADGERVACDYPGRIDLLLTDMVMPKLGGRELAGRLRALRPTMKVLFTSGYTANASQRAAELDSNEPFLAKPYLPELLLQKVREVLDG